ncbi:hypothetical protein XELAEV_18007237mg [Xenopus laevis]|uniref:Ig-like domain-containing protein n=1 Tax=Xenopus laevis TaxID=8355 RepID=A0A974I4A6_XENLA|nr:hypothetical protein XELAEV_18007237mg [Xenopus laevis]
MYQFRTVIVLLLCSLCSSDIIQEPKMDAMQGTDPVLTCSHSSLTTAEMIQWYRQLPDRGPQFLISSYKTTEKDKMSKYSMVFSNDRKFSELHIKDITLEESAVYLCVKSDTVIYTSPTPVQNVTPYSKGGNEGPLL